MKTKKIFTRVESHPSDSDFVAARLGTQLRRQVVRHCAMRGIDTSTFLREALREKVQPAGMVDFLGALTGVVHRLLCLLTEVEFSHLVISKSLPPLNDSLCSLRDDLQKQAGVSIGGVSENEIEKQSPHWKRFNFAFKSSDLKATYLMLEEVQEADALEKSAADTLKNLKEAEVTRSQKPSAKHKTEKTLKRKAQRISSGPFVLRFNAAGRINRVGHSVSKNQTESKPENKCCSRPGRDGSPAQNP